MNRTENVLSKEDPNMLRELDQMEDEDIDTTDIPRGAGSKKPATGCLLRPPPSHQILN